MASTNVMTSDSAREYLVQILIYAAMLTPLIVVSTNTIFPFIFPKAIFFESIVGLLAVILVPILLSVSTYRIKNIYTYVFGVYAIILVLTGIFALNPTRAFWSNFERMTGIVYILTAMAFSYFVAAFFKAHPKRVQSFLSYIVGLSVIVDFTGLYQRIDPSFLMSQSSRVAGTFGNPIYLGGFAAECILVSAYLIYVYRTSSIKWWYVGALVINFIALYLSGTRSSVLALGVAGVFIGIFLSKQFFHQHKKRVISAWAIIVVATAALFGAHYIFPQTFDATSLLFRFTDVRSIFESTGSTRLIAWKIAIKGFTVRPFFGWGPENFVYVFNQYYNAKILTFGVYETWFDHAHNAFFDVLVTQGLIGILGYLAQYAVVLWMCFKTRVASIEEKFLSVALASIFVVHFIHNFFVFDHPASYIMFYAFVGIVVARYTYRNHLADGAQQPQKTVPIALPSLSSTRNLCVMGGILVVTGMMVIPAMRQNYLDYQGQGLASVDLQLSQENFQRALDIDGPFTADVVMDIGRVAQRIPVNTGNDATPFLNVPNLKQFFDFATNKLDNHLVHVDPFNEMVALMEAQLFMNATQAGDRQAAQKSDAAYVLATRLSPDRQQVAYSWARLKMLMQDAKSAEKILVDSINKEPAIPIGHWYLAITLLDVDPERAAREIDVAAQYGYDIHSPANRLLTAVIFGRAGRISEAADNFERALENASTIPWDEAAVKLADEVFQKTNRTTQRDLLHAKFSSPFLKTTHK